MIHNIQYKFKPKELSPGLKEGQEATVCEGLTRYAQSLGVPCFALRLWEGEGEESKMVGYALVDMTTQQVFFTDHRYDVCEYILENVKKKDVPVESS